MSGFRGFFMRNKMMIIIPIFLAGQFYIWSRIQQMECYVPKNQQKKLFVKPLEYAKELYEGSDGKDRRKEEKSV